MPNAPTTREQLEKREGRIKVFVRCASVVVLALIVVVFVVLLTSSRSILAEVSNVQKGPYPVSVAAGHIETDLMRLQTVIEHMTASQLGASDEFEKASENNFIAINEDMQKQLAHLEESKLATPEKLTSFKREYQLLSSRMSEFTKLCWNTEGRNASYEEIQEYADDYIYPLITYLLEMNDGALEMTNTEIERIHNSIDHSVNLMLMLGVILMIAVVITIVVYYMLLRLRDRLDRETRTSLQDALKAADEASAAKSMFLSNMSHDIRTPMNAIVGLTTIADENINDTILVKQCLTRIGTSSQHLLSLINDVLDMNRIESGKARLTNEEFSITGLASEIEMIVQSQPGSKRLNKSVEVVDIEHDLVLGDALRLRQILLNLTSNALKYTNEGDFMSLTITENASPKPGMASYTFVVADTGIGMKREFVERIFEPFEREKNDFTIFTEGTGLGMAITKNLVDLMGGTISVESDLGIGTTVTVTLQFEIAPEDASDAMAADADAGEGASAGAGATGAGASPRPSKVSQKVHVNGRILVVEDNEINMEIAKMLLESRGADVDEATDGEEAFKMASEAPEGCYDLVFMDMQMPHMNGTDATRAIRSFEQEHGREPVPIVAMTANAFDSDRAAALDAGMDDFISKPIDVHRLDAMLRTYLQPVE